MNIKGVSGPSIPIEIKRVERKTQDASPDRDPARQEGEGQLPKRKMTEEEIQNAINYLKALKGIQENNLVVRVDRSNGTAVVFVEDLQGKVIRRIPEGDLWELTQEKEKSKGNIFDKAM